MLALLGMLAPVLAAVVPLLFQKGGDGKPSFMGSLWDRIKGLGHNVTKSPMTTVVGAGGSLSMLGILSAVGEKFQCAVPLTDLSTWGMIAAPFILGALMGHPEAPKTVAPPGPPSPSAQ